MPGDIRGGRSRGSGAAMAPRYPRPMPAVAHPVRDHCLAPDRPVDAPIAPVEGRYGRAFPDLPALEADDDALLALGVVGGLCDGSDATGDDGVGAAGWPFF